MGSLHPPPHLYCSALIMTAACQTIYPYATFLSPPFPIPASEFNPNSHNAALNHAARWPPGKIDLRVQLFKGKWWLSIWFYSSQSGGRHWWGCRGQTSTTAVWSLHALIWVWILEPLLHWLTPPVWLETSWLAADARRWIQQESGCVGKDGRFYTLPDECKLQDLATTWTVKGSF